MCLEREKVVVERGEKIINAFPILLFSKIYILSLGSFLLSFGAFFSDFLLKKNYWAIWKNSMQFK